MNMEEVFSNLEEEEILEISGGDVTVGPIQGKDGAPGIGVTISK